MAKRKTQTFSRWLVQSGDRVWEGTDLADMQRAIGEAFPVNGGSLDIEVGPKRKRRASPADAKE